MAFEMGQTIERELFGEADLERLEKFPEYEKYREAMQTARTLQPGDPKDPNPDFAYEVMTRLEETLNAKEEVSFYTAIGTLFDRLHGVDAWFEHDDGRIVTIDVTTGQIGSSGSKGRTKADIDFPVPRDGLDRQVDEEQFMNYAQALAERIVEFWRSGQEERIVYQAS